MSDSKSQPAILILGNANSKESGKLSLPSSVAVDENDNIFVSDRNLQCIQCFGADGKFLRSFADGRDILSLAYDFKEKRLAALDQTQTEVVFYSPRQGKEESKFGTAGSEQGELLTPVAVAINPQSGTIAVADIDKKAVHLFTHNFEFVLDCSYSRLQAPLGVALLEDLVYISDTPTIQVFNTAGAPRKTFGGEEGKGDTQFHNCSQLSVDILNRRLLIADTGNDRVQIVDLITGKFLKPLGHSGVQPGEFKSPAAVVADSKGRLIVADQGNHRVQILPALPK